MKVLKKIIIWTSIPIILELTFLFLVQEFYIRDEMSFNIRKVDISSKKSNTKINVEIPDDAKDIKVSHNGNYISYCKNNSIYIIDTDNNKKKEVSMENNSKLSYYKWDLDSDVILMAEKFSRAGSSYLKFEAYDTKRDSKTERKNDQNEVLEILLPNKNYEVKNIVFSGPSNVTYVNSSAQGNENRIYRIDRMTEMNSIRLNDAELGNIAAINNQDGDQIIYENRSTNRINIGGRGQVVATGENAMHYLLGTDDNNQVYIGNGENSNVNKIFIADLTQQKINWKIHQLPQSINKKNIYILRDGRIYINDSSKNTVTEVVTGKSIQYKGDLIEIYNYGLISKDGKKILGSFF